MSLTTDIANLVARADALIATFESKKTAIDNAVAAAIAAVPSLSRMFYVDAVLGNDTNSGTLAVPVQTIARAVALTPTGGFGTIRLLSDVHVAANIRIDTKDIAIQSHDDVDKWRLTFARSVDANGARKVTGFEMARWGNIALRFLTVEVPDNTGYEAAIGSPPIIRPAGGSAGVFLTGVKVNYCDVKFPAVPFAPLIERSAPTVLHWFANTMTDQAATGRLFREYTDTTTGTSVTSLPWLVSNLIAI